jgi:TRAP transporter TAXI family solute receptor
MAYAWAGTRSFEANGKIDSFRVVAGLYAEAVQLVTMDPSIKSVADLAGKNVSIGAPGSGVYFNAIDILAAAGLTEADINPQYMSFADSADGLKDGKIDAAFIVAGAPTAAITELCTTNNAYLVPIDGEIAANLFADSPFYTAYTIPAGTYAGQDADVTTVTVKATLIVSADASEEDVYNLCKAIFENVDAIAAENGKGAELSIENATSGMTAPFHAGAAKYFAEKGITVPTE